MGVAIVLALIAMWIMRMIYVMSTDMPREIDIVDPEYAPMTPQERQKIRDAIERERDSRKLEMAAREMERMDADEFERQVINELGGDDDG